MPRDIPGREQLRARISMETSPANDDQRRVLQAIYDHFRQHDAWPVFGQVDRPLRRVGPDPAAVLSSLPSSLVTPFGGNRSEPLREDPIQLTLLGMSLTAGSDDDIERFLTVVRWAAELEATFDPGEDINAVPQLTSDTVHGYLGLPEGDAGSAKRLFAILPVQPWGFGSSRYGPDSWSGGGLEGRDS